MAGRPMCDSENDKEINSWFLKYCLFGGRNFSKIGIIGEKLIIKVTIHSKTMGKFLS
jgi:hypothetical protein